MRGPQWRCCRGAAYHKRSLLVFTRHVLTAHCPPPLVWTMIFEYWHSERVGSFSFHFQLPQHNRCNASLHRELKRSVPFWKRRKSAPGNISNIIRIQITDCSPIKHHPRLTIPTDYFSFFRCHSHLWRARGNRRQSSTIFWKNGDKH